MSAYMKGYRDGFGLVQSENAEQVYEAQCDEIERKLVHLATLIQRRRPDVCKREMREYVALSQYYSGLCDGYHRAKRGESPHDR